jgi:hypothetical protein
MFSAASKTARVSAAAPTAGAFIEDVFSTWLYTGNNSTQTITNGIDLSTKGGLVWLKCRDVAHNHALIDTVRGGNNILRSNSTTAQLNWGSDGITSFNSNGFTMFDPGGGGGRGINETGIYASWTFAKQPKFFDVVTYTGTGASSQIVNHTLGVPPSCIIAKVTSASGDQWRVYTRVNDTTWTILRLNTTGAGSNFPYSAISPALTSTTIDVGFISINIEGGQNVNGTSYVMYLFAHDAGGFGASGTDNAISCGSFTGNDQTVNLGWEPQWILTKTTTSSDNWRIANIMQGLPISGTGRVALSPNSSFAETGVGVAILTPTGFIASAGTGQTNIYIAIRRGPMRTPTSGTSVFTPTVYTGTNVNNRLVNTSIAPDMVWIRQRNDGALAGMVVGDRLRGQPYFLTGTDAEEVTSATAFDQQLFGGTEYGTAFSAMNGVWVGTNATAKLNVNTTANNHIVEAFRRAPGFFDVVCYTGTGSATTVAHNLGVAPELIIVKSRGIVADAQVYASTIGASNYLVLSGAAASTSNANRWNNTAPTASVFTVGTNTAVNGSGSTYVAYLFSSVNGVSKVGTYTGTGATLQVDCGFTAGARLVLIKRTNASGDWYVWDSARGIVAGNDPYLVLNSTAAEVTSTDWVDTLATGFEVSNAGSNLVNVNGGVYLFLAIA